LTARISSSLSVPGSEPGPTGRAPLERAHGRPVAPLGSPRLPVMASELEEGLERVYQDRSLTCRDCAEEFSFSAGEQAFFASKGLTNDPQRCPWCRAAHKR